MCIRSSRDMYGLRENLKAQVMVWQSRHQHSGWLVNSRPLLSAIGMKAENWEVKCTKNVKHELNAHILSTGGITVCLQCLE